MKKLILFALFLTLTVGPKLCPAAENASTIGPASLTATGMTVGILGASREAFALLLTGITGTAGVQVQGSVDGSTWVALYAMKAGSGAVSLTQTASGTYVGDAGGFKNLRAIVHYLAAGQGSAVTTLSWGNGRPNTITNAPAATPVP